MQEMSAKVFLWQHLINTKPSVLLIIIPIFDWVQSLESTQVEMFSKMLKIKDQSNSEILKL